MVGYRTSPKHLMPGYLIPHASQLKPKTAARQIYKVLMSV